jgi:hypothetical protein
MCELLDVVDEAEMISLPFHLRLPPQREPREPLVLAQNGEDRQSDGP